MSNKLKVVFMGTPEFALAPLQALINAENFEILSVVTKPDKKIGRKQLLTPPPVKKMAIENNLPVLQPEKIEGNDQFIELLKGLSPDFIVVVAFGQILPKSVLEIPKFSCVNIHPSLLPKYRGATPVEQALLNNDTQTGVTIMNLDEKMDSGDILLTQRIEIQSSDNAATLYDKLFKLGAAQLPYVLKDYSEGEINPIPQNDSRASYCHKISKEDGLLDLNKMTAKEIFNKIRAYTPWPNCFLKVENKFIKILEAAIDEDSAQAKSSKPNQVISLGNKTLALGTKKGLLIPKKVQLEGKNPTIIEDFLRGYPLFFNKLAG